MGADDSDEREARPDDVAGEMADHEAGSGAPATARADAEEREEGRPRDQRVGRAGHGGGNEDGGRHAGALVAAEISTNPPMCIVRLTGTCSRHWSCL